LDSSLLKVYVAIVTIALLAGCRPAAAPVSTDAVSELTTVTPEPEVISAGTVEQVALLHTFGGHSKRVLDVAFSAEGEWLASSSDDRKIKVWDVRNHQEAHTFQLRSVDMADIDISLDRSFLASGEGIWELESMQELYPLLRGTQLPASVAFSPDGSHLALGRIEQDIKLWDVSSGQPVLTFAEQEEKRTKGMVFSPDGALLAVGVMDGTVRLYDTESGELVNVFRYGGETDIHGLAFSPDGVYLASAGRVSAVILWDVAGGEVVRTFSVRDTVLDVDFSPDGTLLAAAAGAEKAVLLWDVESGALFRSLPHDDQSMAIAFSPDGRYLAAGCFDSQVYLWGSPTNP
jgi:uncharacterized protein with WD repeat